MSRFLSAFVRAECANYRSEKCIFNHGGACPVMRGQKCNIFYRTMLIASSQRLPGEHDYFGSCVAPLAEKKPEHVAAANEYIKLCAQTVKTKPVIISERHCACGEPLTRKKRVCDKCRRKRLNQSQRKWRAGM